jgi:uncharacterized protein YndB with AHSA1/START domain
MCFANIFQAIGFLNYPNPALGNVIQSQNRQQINQYADKISVTWRKANKMTDKNELIITRTFDSPRERVWKAWTDPEHFKKWWGPMGFTCPVSKIDLRVGGKYLHCMLGADGKQYWSTGTYREIVTPQKIVVTDSFADAQGNVVPSTHYGMEGIPMEMQVTLTLEEQSSKTKMTLQHVGLPEGEMRRLTTDGWNQSFDKLAASLKQV